MDFHCHPIVWVCLCGEKPKMVRVGISSLYTLCAEWFCPKCRKTRLAHFPIEKLIAAVPQAPSDNVFTPEDLKGLKDMGILDEGDT